MQAHETLRRVASNVERLSHWHGLQEALVTANGVFRCVRLQPNCIVAILDVLQCNLTVYCAARMMHDSEHEVSCSPCSLCRTTLAATWVFGPRWLSLL